MGFLLLYFMFHVFIFHVLCMFPNLDPKFPLIPQMWCNLQNTNYLFSFLFLSFFLIWVFSLLFSFLLWIVTHSLQILFNSQNTESDIHTYIVVFFFIGYIHNIYLPFSSVNSFDTFFLLGNQFVYASICQYLSVNWRSFGESFNILGIFTQSKFV